MAHSVLRQRRPTLTATDREDLLADAIARGAELWEGGAKFSTYAVSKVLGLARDAAKRLEPLPPLPSGLLRETAEWVSQFAKSAELSSRSHSGNLRPQRELKIRAARPHASWGDSPNTENTSVSSTDARPEPATLEDVSGRGKTDLDGAIRQAMALAILAGDDERAAVLGTLLKPATTVPDGKIVPFFRRA